MLQVTPKELNNNQKSHFYFLDTMRGIAALSVVLFHIYIQSESTISPLLIALPKMVRYFIFEATFGVPIFFVLSGFVIAHSLRNAKLSWPYAGNFMMRRFVRLSPPYYAAIIFALLFGFADFIVRGDSFDLPGPVVLLANAFYLQDLLGVGQIIEVAWTLCVEMQFYAAFIALLFIATWLENRYQLRNSLLITFMSTGLLASLWPLGLISSSGNLRCFIPLWYCFLLGVLCHWVWTKKIHVGWLCFYLLVIMLGGVLTDDAFTIATVLATLVIFAMSSKNLLEASLNWRWLQFLGLISYSLYLTHPPVISATSFVTSKLMGEATVFTACISVLAILGASIAVAAIMWWLCERPSIAWSRKLRLDKVS